MMLTDLADAVRASGLPVIELNGWRTRGHGQMSGVKSVICHHTAGPTTGDTASLNTVLNGRPGLAGPLANLYLSRSGGVYVVSAGLAYHAGVVFSEATSNAYAIGIEAEATGEAAWPKSQYDAYVALCRALIDHYHLTPSVVLGHKEVAKPLGRKPDPNFDMPQFRAAVVAASTANTTGSFLMSLSDAEQREILDGIRKMKPGAVFKARSSNCRKAEDDQYGHVMNGEADAADALAALLALRTVVNNQAAQISQLVALLTK